MESLALLEVVRDVDEKLIRAFDVKTLRTVNDGGSLGSCESELYRTMEIVECALNGVDLLKYGRVCADGK